MSKFFFSPVLKRQFSSKTSSPDETLKPPLTQSLIKRTGLPNLAEITSATGLSEFSSEYTPSSGRPRCEVTITFAPALRANSIVAIEAVIRASEVTLPSLTGTFKSARIKTSLPAKSRSVIFIIAMMLPYAMCSAKRNILQVYPYSLSYHATTLTNVGSSAIPASASKTAA